MASEVPVACYMCNLRLNSIGALQQHLMLQHSLEDLSFGLICSQFLLKLPQLLDNPIFEYFVKKYPHFVRLQESLCSPDIFNCLSPALSNFFGGSSFYQKSYPSTPVMKQDCYPPEMNHDPFLLNQPWDLSPQKNKVEEQVPTFRPRLGSSSSADHVKTCSLSQQSTETEIDVVSLSQPTATSLDCGISDGDRKFRCTECPNSYKLKAHLTRHHRSAHSNERPHQCEYCPKAFKLKELLNQHILTHGVKNPFKCEVCRGKFRSASDLSKHKAVHHNDLIHNCPHCNSKFVSLSYMYMHLHTRHGCLLQCCKCGEHVREKQPVEVIKIEDDKYVCDICKLEFFGDKLCLAKHIEAIHSLNDSAADKLFGIEL